MAENTGLSGKENRRKAAAYRDKLMPLPEDSTFEEPGAREVKDRSSAGPEIAPNPIVDARTALNSSTTDDDFDPAEYARLHGLDVHKD